MKIDCAHPSALFVSPRGRTYSTVRAGISLNKLYSSYARKCAASTRALVKVSWLLHAPPVRHNSQSSGQSVRLVMQTPLQVLSARPKEAVLFMGGQGIERKVQGWRERVCVCVSASLLQRHTRTRVDTRADVLRQMLKCIVSAWLALTSLYAAPNVQHSSPVLAKWIEGWVFSARIIHLRLMPLRLRRKDHPHPPAPARRCPERS